MERGEAIAALTQTALFRDVGGTAVEHVAARLVERRFRRGEAVFREGDDGDSLHVLVAGLVKVTVTSPDGDDLVLAMLRPPDTFGELAVLDRGVRSASAWAAEDTTALALSRAALDECMRETPALATGLLRSLSAVVRRLTDQTSDLVFLDLHGRIAKLLLGMADSGGSEPSDRVLDLQLTQSELASMVGGSRQSVNQILHSFEHLGYLRMEGRRIVIRRPDLLARRAGIEGVSRPTAEMSPT